MKNRIIYAFVLLPILFSSLISCTDMPINDVLSTETPSKSVTAPVLSTETPSKSITAPVLSTETPSKSVTAPVLSKERLEELCALKTDILEKGDFRKLGSEEWEKDSNSLYEFDRIFGYDIKNETYFSENVIDFLSAGMFANEVHAILGNPHINSYYRPKGLAVTWSAYSIYDAYAMYVLETGRVLLLHYTPIFIGEYTQEELMERIPNYKAYEQCNKSEWGRWMKLHNISIVSAEKLCATDYHSGKALITSQENAPVYSSKKNLDKIEVGMTYQQAKAIAGCPGSDEGYWNGGYHYRWFYGGLAHRAAWLDIQFTISETGELIVSKVGV